MWSTLINISCEPEMNVYFALVKQSTDDNYIQLTNSTVEFNYVIHLHLAEACFLIHSDATDSVFLLVYLAMDTQSVYSIHLD